MALITLAATLAFATPEALQQTSVPMNTVENPSTVFEYTGDGTLPRVSTAQTEDMENAKTLISLLEKQQEANYYDDEDTTYADLISQFPLTDNAIKIAFVALVASGDLPLQYLFLEDMENGIIPASPANISFLLHWFSGIEDYGLQLRLFALLDSYKTPELLQACSDLTFCYPYIQEQYQNLYVKRSV